MLNSLPLDIILRAHNSCGFFVQKRALMFTWCDVNANAGDRNIVKIKKKKKSKCRKSSD